MNDSSERTAERVLAVLAESRRPSLKSKDLARALAVPNEDYRDFKRLLTRLVRRGELRRVRGNRYATPERAESATPRTPPDRDRKPERARIVGTFRRGRGGGTVTPLDPRVRERIRIAPGREAGARGGDVVVVKRTHEGRGRRGSLGEIEVVLGPLENPGIDVLAILHTYGLAQSFPDEVESAARAAGERMAAPGERTDLKHVHVFTIDPADAKDHDDALSVVEVADTTWEVGIHIADVSHFVPEGSPLDREAFRRGTSVYLVDQVVPMLPHTLSSDLCSLVEGEDRLALSLTFRMDAEGIVSGHRFERTWIRCRRRLSYQQAQEVILGRAGVDEPTDRALRTLDRLAKAIRAKRRRRGSLDFDLPEARVVLDEDGMPIDILKIEQLDSHRLIEDFMILANEMVAKDAERRGLPITYRVHESPAKDAIDSLREFLQPLGYALPKGSSTPKAFQAVLERAEGHPEEALVSTVILRSMARARYDAENLGHFGLASPAYAHFTSPIRRYPDLMLHRVLARSLIDGKPPSDRWTSDYMARVAEVSSERERVAQQAERDSVDMKKVEFMARHLGDEFEGTVSGVTSFGLFVLLDRYFVEGLIHVGSLGDDYYILLPEEYALVGHRTKRRFRLGDRLTVQVVRTDKEGRRIDFVLVDNTFVSKRTASGPQSPDSPGMKRRRRV